MTLGEGNQHPIQLVVNYWEIHPGQMGDRLNQLLGRGVNHVVSFVPWQAVESDISHRLLKFLQAAADRKISVSLILSPEVGVHYPHSGLPKDLVGKTEAMASHVNGGPVCVQMPPNSFALPSLLAQEFAKRYFSFISRMDGFFADLGRSQPALLENVRLVLTGSFWKYYRSPRSSLRSALGGPAGDYSNAAGVAYRQCVEQYFAQREFWDAGGAPGGRWKTHARDGVNRRWFYQQSEEVFRSRTLRQLRRKSMAALDLDEIELFTPEADPEMTYSSFLSLVSGGGPDLGRLSALVDEAGARASISSTEPVAPCIHWTGIGGFQALSDPEKQFLILKSILTLAPRGGGILIDEREWFSLSRGFRDRAETFARLIAQGELSLRTRALFLTPHLWSHAGRIWEEMARRLGPQARMIASAHALLDHPEASLLMVDPSCIVNRELVTRLHAWAMSGKTVAIARSPLYTEAARAELEEALSRSKYIDVNLGLPFRLYAAGAGKFIVYEMPEVAADAAAWHMFLTAVLSASDIEAYCTVGDQRINCIPLERRGQGVALFVMNGSRVQVSADLSFKAKVGIADFIASFAVQPSGQAVPASRFTLEVPAFGILPLAVEGRFQQAATSPVEAARSQAQPEGLWS